tara:strand:+ start:4882 stop:7635 length:2754 start_codon:yes stop_codon:yes gene_type:complete
MSKAQLNVRLGASTTSFDKAMNKAAYKINKFGKAVQRVGANMTRNLTMPIALIGGASVKMAADFEKSMTKINTLVGVSETEVDGLKKQVLGLAGETAQAPKDLADGLYFLTSAGLSTEGAMKALEQVSKATASGLGEQADLAVVAAAAQNAYGAETLDATGALDMFGQMVKTGMFDAAELSKVLGVQLGLANNLGVGFEDVGAFISTYTRTTGDATGAATGFGAVMMSFAKIAPIQEQALAKINMTSGSLREMLGRDGLQATLLHLQTEFKANGMQMSEFFTKSQALKGVMGVLGESTEDYKKILGEMEKSQGFVNDAFETTAEKSSFKLDKALNDLRIAGTQLGEALFPVVEKLSAGVSRLAGWFSNLSDSSKNTMVNILLFVAAVGPMIAIFGSAAIKLAALIKFIKGARAAMIGLNVVMKANPIGFVISLIALLVGAFILLYNKSQKFRAGIAGVFNAFKAYVSGMWDLAKGVLGGIGDILIGIFTLDTDRIKKGFNNAKNAFGTYGKAIADSFKDGYKEKIEEEESISLADKAAEEAAALSGANSGEAYNEAYAKALADGKTDDGKTDDGKTETIPETDEEKTAREKKEQAIKDSEQRMLELKNKFRVLNATNEQEAARISLDIEEENELAGVVGMENSEALKQKILDNYAIKRKKLLDKQLAEFKKAKSEEVSEQEKAADEMIESWKKFAQKAEMILSAISGFLSALSEQQSATLEKKQEEENAAFEEEWNREQERIENLNISEERKDELLKLHDEKRAKAENTLGEKQDKAKRRLARKAAKREKMMNIASALMSTFNAITGALGMKPWSPLNLVLAGIVGVLGMAQVGMIASTPIPSLAEGGIAYGESLAAVGDYPGAKMNPEVIAPLNTLRNLLGTGTEKLQQIKLVGSISGNDILLANEQAQDDRLRFV